MATFRCPFCQHDVALSYQTYSGYRINDNGVSESSRPETVKIHFYTCPNCERFTIKLDGLSRELKDLHIDVFPRSSARQYPDYVPEHIRSDYEEACAIVDLSPKASATLSRRCIQGMIRDFWGITRSRLIDEINALDEVIPATQKQALHALRKVGNIGAHPNISVSEIIDIEPADAKKLIALIEFFLNGWYVERHAQEQLLSDVIALADD